jgi:hypothetical protein
MDFSSFDKKRIAVVIERRGRTSVVRGTANYEVDEDLGNCLRIRLSDLPGDPHFLFPESAELQILPDDTFGCDFFITLQVASETDTGQSDASAP